MIFTNATAAGEMVTRLSEFCRWTLTRHTEGMTTVGEEIEMLQAYLDIERTRWQDGLKARVEVDPAARQDPLPQFLFLPLIENAIKYGGRTSPGLLEVTALVRSRGTLVEGPGLRIVQGDVLDASAYDAMAGHDVVLSSLGFKRKSVKNPWSAITSPPAFNSRSGQLIVDAMKKHGVKRLIAVSAAGVAESAATAAAAPGFSRFKDALASGAAPMAVSLVPLSLGASASLKWGIGGVVVAPRASELILPVSMAVQHSLTVDQLAHTFAIYPSLSGSLTEAARQLIPHEDYAAD